MDRFGTRGGGAPRCWGAPPLAKTPSVYTRKLAYAYNSSDAKRALSVTWSARLWGRKAPCLQIAALRFVCCFAVRFLRCDSVGIRWLFCDSCAILRYCCFAMRLPLCVFSAASRFVCHVAIRLRFGCCFAIRLLLCDSFAVLRFVCCLAIRQLPAFKQPGSSQAQPGQPRASQGTTWDQQIRIQIPTEHQWGAARFPSCAPSEFARGFTCFSAFQGP